MVKTSVVRQQELQKTIDRDIAARTRAHQERIANLQVTVMSAPPAAKLAAPLVMLAQGDSWFDYPIRSNDLTSWGRNTDVLAKLRKIAGIQPLILSVAHYGDASTQELSLPKKKRMIESLQDASNWMSNGKPDAILFSGGGNDIAGDQFCVFLDYFEPGKKGLNMNRFNKVLGMIEASYDDLFAFRDRYAPGVPIFAHCYDFPIADGTHPPCIGPWLMPSLNYCGWTDMTVGTQIVAEALKSLRDTLAALAADPKNNFFLIETQGILKQSDWANELHPHPEGFEKISNKFLQDLRTRFPGRI